MTKDENLIEIKPVAYSFFYKLIVNLSYDR
jgi:hypothetical protein